MANKGVAGTTRCRAGRQDAASRQASSRLLRCAPALRVTRPNVLTHRVFMAGSELPATSRPICENTSSPEVNPHILCSPFIRGFSQPPTLVRDHWTYGEVEGLRRCGASQSLRDMSSHRVRQLPGLGGHRAWRRVGAIPAGVLVGVRLGYAPVSYGQRSSRSRFV